MIIIHAFEGTTNKVIFDFRALKYLHMYYHHQALQLRVRENDPGYEDFLEKFIFPYVEDIFLPGSKSFAPMVVAEISKNKGSKHKMLISGNYVFLKPTVSTILMQNDIDPREVLKNE